MKEFALSGIWPQGARLPYMECDEDQTRSGVLHSRAGVPLFLFLLLLHNFREPVETCGCLSNQLLLSQRCRAFVSEPGKVLSRPTPNTNRPVSPCSTLVTTLLALAHAPIVFRDQLLKHLDNVPPSDFDAITNKLVQAGSTLEYLKYAEALFEILLVGGLLQPGGQYVEDGTPLSPFSFLNAKEPVEVADIKQYVEVLNKLIRR